MAPLVRYSFRFIILLLVQYILCQMVPIAGYITPYIYYVYILWLPFTISKSALLWISALYGLCLGYLLLSPGLHAAACVLIAYFRPYLLSVLLVKDVKDINFAEPSFKSMGFVPYITYVVILTLIHHLYIIFLQWTAVGHLGFFTVKIILTSATSVLMIAIIEGLLQRNLKTRTSFK
jgi:hypothetical protein